MGSLPPQGNTGNFELIKSNENISVGTEYTTCFVVKVFDVSDSVFTIQNSSETESLEYKVYATPKTTSSVPNNSDPSWVNIIDRSEQPDNYDHEKSKVISPNGVFYESFSNKWGWIIIIMRSTGNPLVAKVWYRGK